MNYLCNCGSGEPKEAVYDASNIFVTYVCNQCRAKKLRGYRKDIFTNPDYETTEDKEPS